MPNKSIPHNLNGRDEAQSHEEVLENEASGIGFVGFVVQGLSSTYPLTKNTNKQTISKFGKNDVFSLQVLEKVPLCWICRGRKAIQNLVFSKNLVSESTKPCLIVDMCHVASDVCEERG